MIFRKNIFFSGICGASAAIIAVSLYSFNAYDATFLSAHALHEPIKNIFGWLGAHIAAVILFMFGLSAYLLVPFLCFLAFFFFKEINIVEEGDRIAAWILFIVTTSISCSLYRVSMQAPFAAGGSIGQFFLSLLQYYFDEFIITVLLATSTFISIFLISRLSLLYVARGIKKISIGITKSLYFFMQSPAINYTIYGIKLLQQKIIIFYQFLKSIVTGKFLEKSDVTIVEFELDQIVQEVLGEGELEHEEKNKDIVLEEFFQNSQPITKNNDGQLYKLPHAHLFSKGSEKHVYDEEKHQEEKLVCILEEKLARFGIAGKVISIQSGPVITLFEYQPDIDAKISKIIALEDDLALALQAVSIRIIAPIPGKSVVGFEIAKKKRRNVLFSSIVHSTDFHSFSHILPLVFGQDTVGNNVVVDLVSMPHLLVAGSTGSGKSVALNTMLMSLLYCKSPEELKLILIDPKRLEFSSYADIAHLLFPIITEPKEAAPVLQWVVKTMEQRYQKMALCGVKNIFDYKMLCKNNKELEDFPYLVIIVDELSDLMMTVGKEVELFIARIAQMARASGIHMILATQRPSVDVITGLIKVNFPSRISFRVTSKIDSRTILDCMGAEKLLGKGDMLFLDSSSSTVRRVHGAYVSDAETVAMISYIRAQKRPEYLEIKNLADIQKNMLFEADDALYQEVITFIRTTDEISISLLQRRFRIGYNRSARIIEMLESEGHILPSDGSKMRKVIH